MSTTRAAGGGRRLPGLVNMTAALLVLVFVLALALRAVASTTPAIAEFAPQAQQIAQAPQEQSSRFGNGANGPAIGPATPSPSPSPASIPPDARLLHCVGDPPRQIEDPQSPPCIPYWAGNNGGKTYKEGVDAVQIRVNCHQLGSDYSFEPHLAQFFNQRFELYGRHIVLTTDPGGTGSCDSSNPGGAGGATDEPTQRADAHYAAAENIFAALTYKASGGLWYMDELAKLGVVNVTEYPIATEPEMLRDSPYIWAYPRAVDNQFGELGTWLCRQLVGHDAVHAGDPTLQTKKRVFGIYLDQQTNLELSTAGLEQQLQSCGSTITYQFTTSNQTSNQDLATELGTAVTQMRTKGVTTVMCLCLDFINGAEFANTATGQGFEPEWVLTTYFGAEDFYEGTWPREQIAHAFGLSFIPKHHPLTSDPAYWALAQQGFTTKATNDVDTTFYVEAIYRGMLELASGLQMAGPDLTPQTFAQGLWRTQFPNPPTSLRMGSVGFPAGTHAMTQDGTEFWFSTQNTGPYANQGPPDPELCYVDHGRRIAPGAWPATPADGSAADPYFNPATCDTGRNDSP